MALDRSDNPQPIINALSVDVEEYFHVTAFSSVVRREDWERLPARVERNTLRLLEVLGRRDVRATFFVLGWVAERNPALVREIRNLGHEIGCHGFSHELIYRQSRVAFREETKRAKGVLEEASQSEVIGYRAASYSITRESLWALDVIREEGFVYDSSIFPVRHDLYGIPGAKTEVGTISTPGGNTIIEVPLSTIAVLGVRLPIGGGGYFRLYPYRLTRAAMRSLNRRHIPCVFYLHPWEIDYEQPRINGPLLSRFRHYNNLAKCEMRLEQLLNDFRFSSIRALLASMERVGFEVGGGDENGVPVSPVG